MGLWWAVELFGFDLEVDQIIQDYSVSSVLPLAASVVYAWTNQTHYQLNTCYNINTFTITAIDGEHYKLFCKNRELTKGASDQWNRICRLVE